MRTVGMLLAAWDEAHGSTTVKVIQLNGHSGGPVNDLTNNRAATLIFLASAAIRVDVIYSVPTKV